MAGALGLVITNDVLVSGQHAQPVYVDDSLPIVGPARACVVVSGGEIPPMGGPAIPVRLAPAGTPAVGPALPVYVIPGGGSLATTMAYTNKVIATGPIAYWPGAESSGTTIVDESGNGRNGAYKAAGEPLLGQTGIGDGRTAPLWDGTNDFGNIFTVGLQGAFNSQEGTLATWFRVSAAGVWTDATNRRAIQLRVDANNRIMLERAVTNNVVSGSYIAGGTTKAVNFTTAGPLTWQHFAITWSVSADQVKFYVGGTQQGATQTGLGVWAGNLAATLCIWGASDNAGSNPWSGYLAHAAVWTSALSAATIATLAVAP